ncbi:hypothetical protein Peur_010159 [Populus x canadensis]
MDVEEGASKRWNNKGGKRYVGKGRFFEATDLFRRMKEERTKPTIIDGAPSVEALIRLSKCSRAPPRKHVCKSRCRYMGGPLLSSCRKYGKIEMAKRAAKHVTELNPKESSSFVLLSNVYAAYSHLEEAMQQRFPLKEKQIDKEPGCSSMEVNGEVHELVSGGRLHTPKKSTMNLMIWDGY